MKTSSLLWPCAALAGAASAANDAFLWTVDAGMARPSANQVASISSTTAERILARRKGITDAAYMHITDESVLADINTFGGYQQPLFGAASTEHPAKLFIRISGYTGEVSEFNAMPDLWVEEPERSLYDTFESKFNVKNLCEYSIQIPGKKDVEIKYTVYEDSASCLPKDEVEYLPALLVLYSSIPTASTLTSNTQAMSTLHRNLIHLATTSNIESTVLVLPPTTTLKKSTTATTTKHSELKRAERPLDLPLPALDTSSGSIGTFRSNSTPASNFTLPRTIPQCFTSESACTNATNSCMGHGKCVRSHASCYKCQCGTTIVRTNKDGSTKSVQWGGNACQKKDISVQFILFAATGVFFTAIVAGAIGMLFNMGSQDLPSVIGAGVVGPRAQR